jgi:hypothetical protein
VKKDTVRKTGNIRKRTSAVEIFPYHAMGYTGEGSDNVITFIFDNRLIVWISLGNRWRLRRPLVSCQDMDTGESVIQSQRMTETKLALTLANLACRKNPWPGPWAVSPKSALARRVIS